MHKFPQLVVIASTILTLTAAVPVSRPPITNIANFVVKTDSLDEARKFYSGVLGYDEVFRHKRAITGGAQVSVFKVNDHQYIEVVPTLERESDDKLVQVGFETRDARKLRDYLAAKSVEVPARVTQDSDGNYSFVVQDPQGHSIEFVEYVKGSLQSKYTGKALSDRRISDHILHVGVHVKSPEAQDKFYRDILGFRLLWQGGPRDDRVDWISLLTPDGDNWIEYMVQHDGPPTPQQLGVWHHVCVGTLDMQAVYKTVMDRGYKPPREPDLARDGRMLLQLYDKHNTRTEVMVRKPVEKPCCSENMDPYIK
ncbi:MAG TPA: VOC family protein [Bryobacteraceae bacterium]|jgi:catechol 2,3-dioxygenase-like lactoylglutathione lyase family enzyme